ncbi:hypothetical protein RCL_jg7700.t2 [Rhizophagus clarus]|uniref:Uncharacterized protein n=1 Tax=Rhizophagus clarus TaxID=94130 RepID=A0A8H3R3T7_9GLOM|nr:hypothetical protein RCL_jg7700.t2 [Rhizophagus clarus]
MIDLGLCDLILHNIWNATTQLPFKLRKSNEKQKSCPLTISTPLYHDNGRDEVIEIDDGKMIEIDDGKMIEFDDDKVLKDDDGGM